MNRYFLLLSLIVLAFLLTGCGAGNSEPCEGGCEQGEFCDGTQCVPCTADRNCGPNCLDCTVQKSNRTCVSEQCGCGTEADCESGQTCEDGTCSGVSVSDFIAGADHDPCYNNIPVCQQTAGCTLGESKYIEGDFPGYTNFVVITPADATIVIKIFFKTREHPGVDTKITWYEPGCHDSYNYESGGEDIFAVAAGADGVFTKEQKIKIEGDHLIEIYSDAGTHYFIRVELQLPHN